MVWVVLVLYVAIFGIAIVNDVQIVSILLVDDSCELSLVLKPALK